MEHYYYKLQNNNTCFFNEESISLDNV